MNRRFVVTIRGKSGAEFGFPFDGDPQHLDGWRAEGFNVEEVVNTIPVWVANLGLVRAWCRLQDAWRWLRLF